MYERSKDPITPSIVALHGALVEVTLRLGRVEQRLGVAREPEPCSCDESLGLRARVRELEAQVELLGGAAWR